MRRKPASDQRPERQHEVVDEGSLHKYRTEIPNTVIRGLKSRGISVHAKWLYVYLKSVTGDNGTCFRNTTTIALESGMSRAEVSNAKKALVTEGLIVVLHGKNPNRNTDLIRIKDIWPANMKEFSVHHMNTEMEVQNLGITDDEHSSVHMVNTKDEECSYGERSVHMVNSSVHMVNQRRSQEEDPSKKEIPLLPSGDTPTQTRGEKISSQPQRPRTKPTKKDMSTDYTPAFELVWHAYPSRRKQGKVATFAIFQAHNLQPRAPEIAEKLERLSITLWADCQTHHIPLPTTWFNQKRYEDELVPHDLPPGVMSQREHQTHNSRLFLQQKGVDNGHHGSEPRRIPGPTREGQRVDG